jgi:hypothetical protein
MQRAMQAKLPAKIDIGPVYNVDPQRRKAYTGARAALLCPGAPFRRMPAHACSLIHMPWRHHMQLHCLGILREV